MKNVYAKVAASDVDVHYEFSRAALVDGRRSRRSTRGPQTWPARTPRPGEARMSHRPAIADRARRQRAWADFRFFCEAYFTAACSPPPSGG
jgi:hypothetical protein